MRVLASTTSHKREALLPTLEIFSRLDLREIDLNLHHVLECGVPVESIAAAAAEFGLRIDVVSGGWCDFFHDSPRIEETFASVARQADIARRLGAGCLRLFFGRLAYDRYSPAARQLCAANLVRLSQEHSDLMFVFENHDGASLNPRVCREILEAADRSNIRMNFDPINFAKAGLDAMAALDEVRPFVAHMHLKGMAAGEYCEFGKGDVDLLPVLQSLVSGGYRGAFSVEYEGPHDGTLRLYESVGRARSALQSLLLQ